MIRNAWAAILNPRTMRTINGWLTIIWFVAAVPICLWFSDSVPFLVWVSVYAVVTGHWATWAAARVEVKQEDQAA